MAEDDEGVIPVAGYGPVRKMRYTTLNRVEWEDAASGRRFSMTTPREEVVYVRMVSY